MLPQEAINEFKQLYFEDYGITLSDKEATEKAYQVFNCLKTIVDNPVVKDEQWK